MEKQLNSYSLPVKQVDYNEKQHRDNEGSISPYVRVLVRRFARKEAKGQSNYAKGYSNFAKGYSNFAKGYSNFAKGYPSPSDTANVH